MFLPYALAIYATLAAVSAAATSAFPRGRVPSLAFSSPKPFLGLDDGFSEEIGNIIFLPGFHACGTLSILALDPSFHLSSADLEALPAYNGSLQQRWLEGPTAMREGNSSEGTILAWANGWRNTCGRGAANKEVRVTKLEIEGLGAGATVAERAQAIDSHVLPHLASLPAPPHNSVVLVTSVSEATLLRLFDAASPVRSSPSRPPTPGIPDRPARRTHGFFRRVLGRMIEWTLLGVTLVAAVKAGEWLWLKWQARRGVALPDGSDEELRLDLDSSDEE